MKRLTVAPAAALVLLGVGQLKAETTPIMSFDLGSTSLASMTDATIGWEFTANTDVHVVALGYLDPTGAGFTDQHEVGIFNASQSLVVSTVVQSGTASPLVDGFRYEPVTPTLLAAGQTYVVAGRNRRQAGVSSMVSDPVDLVFRPEISFVGGRTNGGAEEFSYPGAFFSPGPGYFGPNFQIPEPSTFVLSAMGVLGLLLYGSRRRR
ncbi:MAG: PEP-CTERM sorting domain-containing protein [Planctomycetota bacterium]|jgi:hypothetical protein